MSKAAELLCQVTNTYLFYFSNINMFLFLISFESIETQRIINVCFSYSRLVFLIFEVFVDYLASAFLSSFLINFRYTFQTWLRIVLISNQVISYVYPCILFCIIFKLSCNSLLSQLQCHIGTNIKYVEVPTRQFQNKYRNFVVRESNIYETYWLVIRRVSVKIGLEIIFMMTINNLFCLNNV